MGAGLKTVCGPVCTKTDCKDACLIVFCGDLSVVWHTTSRAGSLLELVYPELLCSFHCCHHLSLVLVLVFDMMSAIYCKLLSCHLPSN